MIELLSYSSAVAILFAVIAFYEFWKCSKENKKLIEVAVRLAKNNSKHKCNLMIVCNGAICSDKTTLAIIDDEYAYELCAYVEILESKVVEICVKRFHYNNDIEGSKAYAYRCAEELKEKMEEEI